MVPRALHRWLAHSRTPGRSWTGLLAVAVALTLPGIAAAQDLSDVREQRQQLQQRLDTAAERLNELEIRVAQAEDEATALATERTALDEELQGLTRRIDIRVRELYKRGTDDPISLFLATGADVRALSTVALVTRAVGADLAGSEAAAATRIRLGAVSSRLEQQQQELSDALIEQEGVTSSLEADLAEAAALESRLEAEEQRRREEEARRQREARARAQAAAEARARALASPSGRACPVASPRSFTDTWGAPRSGGRRHKGTDILAPRSQHVIAITSGVWDVRRYGNSAGNWGILRGDDGHSYYYMHLEQHLVGDGARVAVGDVVATNGDTGNARGTTPHVHFEYHPGGGAAINPYPMLSGIC